HLLLGCGGGGGRLKRSGVDAPTAADAEGGDLSPLDEPQERPGGDLEALGGLGGCDERHGGANWIGSHRLWDAPDRADRPIPFAAFRCAGRVCVQSRAQQRSVVARGGGPGVPLARSAVGGSRCRATPGLSPPEALRLSLHAQLCHRLLEAPGAIVVSASVEEAAHLLAADVVAVLVDVALLLVEVRHALLKAGVPDLAHPLGAHPACLPPPRRLASGDDVV